MSMIVGDVNVVNAMLFGGSSNEMNDLIQNEHKSFISRIDPVWGGQVLQRTQEIFTSFTSESVSKMVANALNQLSSISQPDSIYTFTTLAQMQAAKPMMQSYIMANPVIREAYHKGRCDGYSDTYVDPSPGIVGFGHAAYAHVMDGVIRAVDLETNKTVRMQNADNDTAYTHSNFSAAWVGEDQLALQVAAKGALQNTWLHLERLFAESEEDPVNPWGGNL